MLPVKLEQLIQKTASEAELWINMLGISCNETHGALVKQCTDDCIISTIKSVEQMVGTLDKELIEVFDIRPRKHPLTTAYSLFPVLSVTRFFDYLKKEGIVEDFDCKVVGDNDVFNLDLSSNTIQHEPKSSESYSGAYLFVRFVGGVNKIWYMNEHEMLSAYDSWLTQVFGGLDVFGTTEEWVAFALTLRALKTFDVFDHVINHSVLPVFKSRLTAFYSEYFNYFTSSNNARFANCVNLSKYLTTEGSQIEAELQKMDEYIEPPANVITLGYHKLNSDDKNDIAAEDDDYSDIDFGVI